MKSKDLLNRPGLVVFSSWSLGISLAWLLLPGQLLLGVIALIGALLAAGAALLLKPALLPLAVLAVLLGMVRAELPSPEAQFARQAAALAGTSVDVLGRVSTEPTPVRGGFQLLIQPRTLTDHHSSRLFPEIGQLAILARGESWPEEGDEVRLSGKLRLPTDYSGFNRRTYLQARGVYLEMSVSQVEVVAPAGLGWQELPSRLRALYEQAINRLLPQPAAALLLGIVLGVHKGVPSRLEQELSATGLIHLLVLSGLKVAIFARLINGALLPLLGRLALPCTLSSLALYCLAGGATPAALRASLMGGIALLAQYLGRPTHLWTGLAAAAAALLGWEPQLINDIGFQLSFIGTVAIVLFTPSIQHRLTWMPSWFREPFAVTAAAQLGTTPLLASSFHLFSLIAPLANALILPLLPLLVAGGLLLAPLAVIPSIGQLAALPLAALLQYLIQLAELLSRIPGACINISFWSPLVTLSYYLALLGGVLGVTGPERGRKPALVLGIFVPLAIACFELAAWTRPHSSAVALEVGQGQAVLINAPLGHLLIDGGSDPAQLASRLGSHLPPWQHQLDGVVLTGTTTEETGGLVDLPYQPSYLLLPRGDDSSGSFWRTTVQFLSARGAVAEPLVAGTDVKLGGVRLEVLAPESSDPESSQLMLRLVGPSHSLCVLAAKASIDQQNQAVNRLRGGCDYLVLSSDTELAPAWLTQAQPERVIVSGPLNRRRGRPAISPDRVSSTAQEGDIEILL